MNANLCSLVGKCIERVETRTNHDTGTDLIIGFSDGSELRVGMELQYCNAAWLELALYHDQNCEWIMDIPA